MDIYNPTRCSIYNEQLAQKKNHHDKHGNLITIPLTRDL